MIVAEIQMLASQGLSFGGQSEHRVRFADLDVAEGEYRRIAELLDRKTNKANDLPKILEVVGAGNKVTLPLDDLRSVALFDFDLANKQEAGLKEAFPNLYR